MLLHENPAPSSLRIARYPPEAALPRFRRRYVQVGSFRERMDGSVNQSRQFSPACSLYLNRCQNKCRTSGVNPL